MFGIQVGFDSTIDVPPIISKSRKQQYNDCDISKQKSTASVNHSGNKGKKVPEARISLEVSNIVLTDEEKHRIMCERVQSLTIKDLMSDQLKQLRLDASIKMKGLTNKVKMLEA